MFEKTCYKILKKLLVEELIGGIIIKISLFKIIFIDKNTWTLLSKKNIQFLKVKVFISNH